MQIHEITKLGKKRTDEGLLDTFKQAVGITPKPGEGPTKFQKMTNPSLAAVERNKKALGPAADAIAKLKAQGYDVSSAEEALSGYSQAATPQAAAAKMQDANSILKQAMQEIQQDQQAQAEIKGTTRQFNNQFVGDEDFPTLMPDPGTVINIEYKGTKYNKDEKGVWRNEAGNIIPPQNTAGLDDAADQGGKIGPSPAAFNAKMNPPKGAKNKPPMKESILREARKTLEQTAFEDFIAPRIQGKDSVGKAISFNEVLQIPEVKKKLRDIFKAMFAANNSTPPDKKAVIDGFRQYMTVALAGLKVVSSLRDSGKVDSDDSETSDNSQATQTDNIQVDDNLASEIANKLQKIPRNKRKSVVKKAFKQANSGGV